MGELTLSDEARAKNMTAALREILKVSALQFEKYDLYQTEVLKVVSGLCVWVLETTIDDEDIGNRPKAEILVFKSFVEILAHQWGDYTQRSIGIEFRNAEAHQGIKFEYEGKS